MWPSDWRPTVRPSVRTTGIPMFTLQCLHFLATLGAQEKADCTSMLWSKQGIRWPVSPDCIVGSGVDPSRLSIFLKLSADNLLVFKWSQPQFFLNPYQICCVYVTFAQDDYGFNFKLTSDAKIQPVFLKYRRGRPFLTMVTCWSCSTSNFYALIG